MDPDSSVEEIGLVLQGADESRPVYFYVVAGIDFNEENLPVFSATGLPEPESFPSVDPADDPLSFREAITDVNVRLSSDSKQFYKDTVEQKFQDLITDNIRRIRELVQSQSPLDALEDFIRTELNDFRVTELSVHLVDYEEILFGDSEDGETRNDQESDGQASSDSQQTGIEVTPVIDVNHGVPVESLVEGREVLVKFTDEAIEQYNLSDEYQEAQLSSTFQDYQAREGEAEGRLSVEIQEGVMGVADVSRGSLIKVPEHEREEESKQNYEDRISYLIIFVALGLVVLAAIILVGIL